MQSSHQRQPSHREASPTPTPQKIPLRRRLAGTKRNRSATQPSNHSSRQASPTFTEAEQLFRLQIGMNVTINLQLRTRNGLRSSITGIVTARYDGNEIAIDNTKYTLPGRNNILNITTS